MNSAARALQLTLWSITIPDATMDTLALASDPGSEATPLVSIICNLGHVHKSDPAPRKILSAMTSAARINEIGVH